MKKPFALDPVLRHGVVFASDKPIRIHGVAPLGTRVRLEFLSFKQSTVAINGRFSFELPAMEASSTPFSFRVKCGLRTLETTNCLIGDVYLFLGGTEVWNRMEFLETKGPVLETIRILSVVEPFRQAGPAEADGGWRWQTISKESMAKLSSIAATFALSVGAALKRPIGIVVAARPNAGILSMMEPSLYYRAHQFERMAQASLSVFRDVRTDNEEITNPSIEGNRPGQFFEDLFLPVANQAYTAIVFAQDVSDSIDPDLLEDALRMTYYGWRVRLNDLSLPILLAQFADCLDHCPNANRHALIREAQRRTLSPSKHIYLATSSLFEQTGAQTSNVLRVLVDRLVKVVLEKIHKSARNQLSPSYFSHSKKNGLVIYTDYNMLPLVSRSNRNLGFSVSYDGQTFHPLQNVKLLLNQIILEGVSDAKEIRYDFENHPISDIASQNGLPLLPFRLSLS